MAGVPFTARFPKSLIDRLSRRSSHLSASRARMAERYIDEGLRMDEHPGIVFRDGPGGRRATVIGALDVWQIIAVINDQTVRGEQAIAAAAQWLGLDDAHIRVAVGYYGEFNDEIDALIDRNRIEADAAEAAWLRGIAALS